MEGQTRAPERKVVYLTPLKKIGYPIIRRDIWVFVLLLYPILAYTTYTTWDRWHPTIGQVLSELEFFSKIDSVPLGCPSYRWIFDVTTDLPPGVPLLYPDEVLPVDLIEPLLKSSNFALILFAFWGLLITLSILSALLPFWTAKYRKFIQFSECDQLNEHTTHILVEAKGKKAIFCPIFEHKAFVDPTDRNRVRSTRSIEYMKKTYNVLPLTECPTKLKSKKTKYITRGKAANHSLILVSPQGDFQLSLDQLKAVVSEGGVILNKKQLENSIDVYGYNEQDIPIPSFLELFGEHAVSPLFVFQIFCLILWMVDELWQFSLMTLFTLVMFEGQMVFRRRKDLMLIKGMHVAPIPIAVNRYGKWWKMSSVNLMPGDMFSIAMGDDLSSLQLFPSKHPLPRARFNAEDGSVSCPCDCVLLEGSVVANEALLTGESLPQMKNALDFTEIAPGETLQVGTKHKRSALFAGTSIILETKGAESKLEFDGALCYCLRTGFRTTQGKLIRTVLYSSERATAASMEAVKFLLILLCVAILSSAYVLYCSWGLPNRNHFKLLVHCIMIITSVVPPDLPITMSMTVTLALAGLTKKKLYCTEPFRIPFAGQLTTCCFDKTGTLTSTEVTLEGVTGVPKENAALDVCTAPPNRLDNTASLEMSPSKIPTYLPQATLAVMACCHSLLAVQKKSQLPLSMRVTSGGKIMKPEIQILGDPLEKAMLSQTGWSPVVGNVNVIQGNLEDQKSLILRRFHFASEHQRMTVIAKVNFGAAGSKVMVLCKGAPEKIQSLLRHVPSWYRDEYQKLSLQGRRVLALAAKPWTGDISKIGKEAREDFEKDLSLCGILVFGCQIKKKTTETLRILKNSGHSLVMITGDDPRTAAYIALETELVSPKSRVFFYKNHTDSQFVFYDRTDPDITLSIDFTDPIWTDRTIDTTNLSLCVTGRDLARIPERLHPQLLARTRIFARVTPSDKEYILRALNAMGETTLMCGDGTNDVGALKAANVGISLLNFDIDKIKENKKKQLNDIKNNVANVETLEESRIRRRNLGLTVHQIQYLEGIQAKHQKQQIPFEGLRKATEMLMRKQIAALEEKYAQENLARAAGHSSQGSSLMKQLEDQMNALDDEVPLLKPGDASMASPFTYRGQNIKCVKLLVRCGKATLATVMMNYKLMALNSLTTAFALSVLTLNGVKFGDVQSTVEGIFISVLFIATSNAKGSKNITTDRVVDSMFDPYFYVSIILQALTHISTCLLAWRLAAPHVGHIDLDGPFQPNLVNTVIFLMSAAQHCSSFTANYEGAPFLASMKETKVLGRGLTVFVLCLYALTAELFPLLNSLLKLVPFPNSRFRSYMLTLISVDIALSTAIGTWFTHWGRVKRSQELRR